MARLHRNKRSRADRRPCQSMSAGQTCSSASWKQSEGKHPLTTSNVCVSIPWKKQRNNYIWPLSLPGWYDYRWNRLYRAPGDNQAQRLPIPSQIRRIPQVSLHICEQRGLSRHTWQVNRQDVDSQHLDHTFITPDERNDAGLCTKLKKSIHIVTPSFHSGNCTLMSTFFFWEATRGKINTVKSKSPLITFKLMVVTENL